MNQSAERYVWEHEQEALELLKTLAQIPAPSGHEEKRAEFCRNWLTEHGVEGVFVDEALNVRIPFGVQKEQPLYVIMAHMDVVFPDMKALKLEEKDGRLYAPGVGDDTANLAVLLMCARYIAQEKILPRDAGVLLVANSGEEGLGNLKGCRKIMEDYGDWIQEFISLDGSMTSLITRAVGSRRYRVEILTEGGHSYGSFGNRNAIAYMASLINSLYAMKVPENGRTTFNVGLIQGGTSVNTIAQHSEMLYEFRSDSAQDLDIMERHFQAALAYYREKGVEVRCQLLGERPCGSGVDEARQAALVSKCVQIMSRYNGGILPREGAGSTDCNLPLSSGIPSVCFGCYAGSGAHTRGEYVELDSLLPGQLLGMELILSYFVLT